MVEECRQLIKRDNISAGLTPCQHVEPGAEAPCLHVEPGAEAPGLQENILLVYVHSGSSCVFI